LAKATVSEAKNVPQAAEQPSLKSHEARPVSAAATAAAAAGTLGREQSILR